MLQSLPSSGRIRVETVDFQQSIDDSVLITMVGLMLQADEEQPHRFVHTFLLAASSPLGGYFVRNEILRFLPPGLFFFFFFFCLTTFSFLIFFTLFQKLYLVLLLKPLIQSLNNLMIMLQMLLLCLSHLHL